MSILTRRGRMSAAVPVALAGLACAAVLISWQHSQVGRSALSQAQQGVRGRMVAMGEELEREGAKAAGASLIREANELAAHKGAAGARSSAAPRKTHKLSQASYAHPEDIGFQGGAPYKKGKYGNKVYDAPHVGGTNGVFLGSNGGGNGWARKEPGANGNQQALSAVAPPFASSFGYVPQAVPQARPVEQRARAQRPPMRQLIRNPAALPVWGQQPRPAIRNRRAAPYINNLLGSHELQPSQASSYAGVPDDPWEEEWGPYAPYPDYDDWENDWDWEDEDEAPAEEEPAEEEEEHEYPPRHLVATGEPAAYDGRWGSQFYKNAGGNEEAMRKAGVRYDDYPIDVYRSIPYFPYDPAATKQAEQNQKIRAGKKMDEPHTQAMGANKGGETMAAGWGTWNEGGEAEDNTRKAGLKLDRDPLHFRSGFPLPAWDKSEYDQKRHIAKKPAKDAWEAVHNHRKSQVALESKGISVNGFPIDKPEHREYNQIDGMMDTLVPTEDTPKYRDGGVASQEEPLHFLLGEDVNGKAETQADGINKVFASGDLDKRRQNVVDRQQGIELHPDKPVGWASQEEEEPQDEDEEAGSVEGDWDEEPEGHWEWHEAPGGDGEWIWEESREPETWSDDESYTWPGESQWQGVNQGAQQGYDESVWA